MIVTRRRGPDDEERLARRDKRYPDTAPHRFATQEEIDELRAELDAKWFDTPARPYTINYVRDRLKGAAGD